MTLLDCTGLIFPGMEKNTLEGIAKDLFLINTRLSALNFFFRFFSEFYEEKGGVGMGLLLEPTFANG